MRIAAWLLAGLLVPATAQAGHEPVSGELAARGPVTDADFGVSVQAVGLRREVEFRVGDDWHPDSDGVPASSLPRYDDRDFWSDQASLAGRRVLPEVLQTLDGWEPVPAEDALSMLPPNLSMVFQAHDEWLVSSLDASAPEDGDLRLRWWSLPGGAVHGMLEAGPEGHVAVDADGLRRGAPGPDWQPGLPADGIPGLPDRPPPGGGWMLAVWLLAGVLIIGGFVLRRRLNPPGKGD